MHHAPFAVALLALSSLAAAQCIMAPGAPIPVTQDSITGPNPIGFAFPFDGATYTDIHISDHGICFLSNNGVPAPPGATPLVYTPVAASLVANGPVICPHWSDSVPSTTSLFLIDAQSTVCTVTWVDIQSYGFPTPLMTMQLKLDISGQMEFIYGPTVTNNSTFGGVSDNGVVGVSPGTPATLPAASDFRSSPNSGGNPTIFEDFVVANSFDMAGDRVLLIPSNPGWVILHFPGGSGCANSVTFGNGCDGLTLASNLPVLGTNWDLTTSGLNAASQVGFTFFAFGRQTPSIPLTTLGFNAPGCESHILLTSIVTNLVGVASGGTTTISIAVPISPAFAGVVFDAQSIGLTTNNPAGLATSNGLEGTFGT